MAVSRLQSILALTSAVIAVGGLAWWAAVHNRAPAGDAGIDLGQTAYQVPPVGSQATAPSPLALSNPGSQVLFSFDPNAAQAASGGNAVVPNAQVPSPAAVSSAGAPLAGYGSADGATGGCNCPDSRVQAFGSIAAAAQSGLGNVLDFVASQVPSIYADPVGPTLTASLAAANDQRAAILAVTNAA